MKEQIKANVKPEFRFVLDQKIFHRFDVISYQSKRSRWWRCIGRAFYVQYHGSPVRIPMSRVAKYDDPLKQCRQVLHVWKGRLVTGKCRTCCNASAVVLCAFSTSVNFRSFFASASTRLWDVCRRKTLRSWLKRSKPRWSTSGMTARGGWAKGSTVEHIS